MSELNDKTMVEVVNNGTGSVSYFSELSRMKRRWDKPNSTKKVSLEELRELVSMAGGFELLTDSLLIKDMKVREEIGLPVDDEYMLDEKGVNDLLKKSASVIDKTLEVAPDSIIDKVASVAIDTNLSNLDKIEVIKEHSGIDVLAAIQEKKESQKDTEEKTKEETKKKNTGKRGRPRRSQN